MFVASVTVCVSHMFDSVIARRIDDDKGRTHELAQSAVKCMRGILECWMRQADKLENFKLQQNVKNVLHSKFHLVTGDVVATEDAYHHLQVCLPLTTLHRPAICQSN